jgi:hypothetical protein
MTYNFLTDADIHTVLKEEFKQGMTDSYFAGESGSTFILKAEKTAIQQMKNKLCGRFQVDKLFVLPGEWDKNHPYVLGEYCLFKDVFYEATRDNQGYQPGSDDNWEEHDPRDPLLVTYVADITVYHLHARNAPRLMTELRVKRYDDAIKWLNGVMKNQENPDFPLLEDDPLHPLEYYIDTKERRHYY